MATLNPNLPRSEITSRLDAKTITELDTLLRKAAALAAANGVSLDAFASAAWQAFLDAMPGLRDELETRALIDQIGQLRERGLVGSA